MFRNMRDSKVKIFKENESYYLFMITNKCGSPLSPRKLLFATDKVIVENHEQPKCRAMEPRPKGYICKTISALKAQWSLQKRRWKVFKNQRIANFAVSLWLLVMLKAVTTRPHQFGCLNMSWQRRTTIDMLKWPLELSCLQRLSPGKWDVQSYHNQEVNSANDMNELGKIIGYLT